MGPAPTTVFVDVAFWRSNPTLYPERRLALLRFRSAARVWFLRSRTIPSVYIGCKTLVQVVSSFINPRSIPSVLTPRRLQGCCATLTANRRLQLGPGMFTFPLSLILNDKGVHTRHSALINRGRPSIPGGPWKVDKTSACFRLLADNIAMRHTT